FQNKRSTENFAGVNNYGVSSPANQIMSNSNGSSAGSHFTNSLVFKHQFTIPGRTVVVEYSDEREQSTGHNSLVNLTDFYATGAIRTDSLAQMVNQRKRAAKKSADLTYTEPFGKKSLLMLHFSPQSENQEIIRNTFSSANQLTKSAKPDSGLSTYFTSRYLGHQGGIGYKIGAKENQFTIELDYRAGRLDGENAYLSNHVARKYFNLLPELNWKMRISPSSSIKLQFHSLVDLPVTDKMQDAVDNSEPLFYSRGNSGLLEQTAQKLSARYTYINLKNGSSFFVNLSAQKAENYFSSASFTASSDTVVAQNVVLKKGGQISMPINMNGYINLRSVFSFSLPLKPVKSVVTWNGGLQMAQTPGMVNGIRNISETQNYSSGLVLVSNISSFIDFNLSYSGNISRVNNSIKPGTSTYFSQITSLRINLLSKTGWLFQNDLTNQSYSGLAKGYNQHFCSWNLSAGKKFLKKQAGELKLSVFDLLKQNRNISRTVTETYIEDVKSLVLEQYYMLTFTYRFKAFSSSK
ncbi:MAG: outer membrane beta-barrel protein, partial [Chitinophagaceae bacterium]